MNLILYIIRHIVGETRRYRNKRVFATFIKMVIGKVTENQLSIHRQAIACNLVAVFFHKFLYDNPMTTRIRHCIFKESPSLLCTVNSAYTLTAGGIYRFHDYRILKSSIFTKNKGESKISANAARTRSITDLTARYRFCL